MKAITIRIDDNIFEKIEIDRGDRGRADYFRNLVESHFNKDDSLRIAEKLKTIQSESDSIKKELEHSESKRIDLLNQIDSFKSEIKTLEQQLSIQNESHKSAIKILEQQLGFLQLEYQKISNRLLLEEPKKPWYQFWKK